VDSTRSGRAHSGHLARPLLQGDHGVVRRKRRERATLDDVVEVLQGVATILMEIDAKLEDLARRKGDDEDEEEEGP
jgi:hypothetical protein